MGPAGRYGLSRGARAIDRSAAKTQSAHARNHRAGSAQRRDRPGSDFFVARTPEARVSRQSTGAKTRVNLAEDLQRGIEQLGIALSTEAQIKLLDYLALLHKWNRVYNLTAIRYLQQMVSNHLLDSLAVMPHLWAGRWLDVGCGAGLPGGGLAVAQRDRAAALLDSNSKKTNFGQQGDIRRGLR